MLHSPKKILANIHAITLYCDLCLHVLCIILVYVCMMLPIIGGGHNDKIDVRPSMIPLFYIIFCFGYHWWWYSKRKLTRMILFYVIHTVNISHGSIITIS
jgi:hypothetical protein